MTTWILYGANGYTGELIAREAIQRGLHPGQAGRDAAAILKLAVELGCPSRVFGLSNAETVNLIFKSVAEAGLVDPGHFDFHL